MRDFSKVSPVLWHSPRFNGLQSDDARYLYLYFLTCEHQNSAGCYRIPDAYACNDLRWQQGRYVNARKLLIEADLILFDEPCEVVMLCRWFKHNPPMNEKHSIGIERILERLPSPSVHEVAVAALNAAWERIAAEKVTKAQRQQKGAQGLPNGSQAPMPQRLQTSFLKSGR